MPRSAAIIRSLPLQPGSSLGPYEILAPIGAGGMGEVYRARDARLHRDVATKIGTPDQQIMAASYEGAGKSFRADRPHAWSAEVVVSAFRRTVAASTVRPKPDTTCE